MHDIIIRYSHAHRTEKFSQQCSIIWPVLVIGLLFVYKLSGRRFNSNCSHLNFRLRACFEQWIPQHSGNFRVWIYSKCVCDMIITYSQMHRTDKFSQHSSSIWSAGLNGWLFIYELNGCRFHSQFFLQSPMPQIWCLIRGRSFLTFRQI